ncbi:MAG: hypothetical protein HY980_01225 [Candidatus Magasanikbacteria bacterium]|nr:hypothetical protein [Candidatus Magasanikbacteria bacterium]
MKNFKRGFKSDNDGGSRNRQMHSAICSKCAQECEVPFRPTGDRPVFCSNCFKSQVDSGQGGFRGEKRGRFGGDRFGGDKRMFGAVCSKCGTRCEVPFQPSPGKPVYCKQCFGKGDGGAGKGAELSKEQFALLNAKLDKILTALNPAASNGAVKEKKAVKSKKVSVTKTKPAGKKTAAKKKK